MTTTDPKIDYLKEHIPYEYWMFHYTFDKLKSCSDQYDWNAFFVSCVVYGRNVYLFLRDDNDNRNYAVSDFVHNEYKQPGPLGVMQRLSGEVLHIGKRRMTDAARKAGINEITKLFNWIERHWPAFKDALKPEYMKYWTPTLADAMKFEKTFSFNQTAPRSTTAPPTATATSISFASTAGWHQPD
jgi:hypothetical protein